MRRMHKLVTIYQEIQDNMGYYLKLFRLGNEKGVTPEQIMKLVQMADNIHRLQDKFQELQREILNISRRKSVGEEELKNLHNEVSNTKEKLDLVKKTFNTKYEELKEACSRAQKLQNYVEQFIEGQDYQELESVVRNEVEKTLLDNKRLLQNALFSVLLALRNDPDRYFIVDRMELAPFTINTIINYNSFLRSKRGGPSQSVTERVLERAERLLVNLQKNMVDNTISTAAGLEDGRSHATACRVLPYYESPSQLSTEQS
jgi:chromosome segregation ATPase